MTDLTESTLDASPADSTSESINEALSSGFVRVGKVKDAHGIKGELFIVLFAGEAAWLEKLKDVRLVKEDKDVQSSPEHVKTFAAKSVRLHKNGLIAKTLEIKDRNHSETLKGWFFEVPSDFLVSEVGETIYLREIEGFKVFTKDKGEIGTITGFGSNTRQDLLIVTTKSGDYEIPFVEAFVDTLDFDARELHLDIPEGLLGELDGEKQSDGQNDSAADDADAADDTGDDADQETV